MNSTRHCRGNELADHIQAKRSGYRMMRTAGFDLVVCEYRNADLVGMSRINGHLRVVAVEFERTPKNVVQNIRRNLRNHSDCVLEVCMTPSVQSSVERLLAKTLTEEERRKVLVLGVDELTVELLRSLNGKQGVDSGSVPVDSGVDSTGTALCSG